MSSWIRRYIKLGLLLLFLASLHGHAASTPDQPCFAGNHAGFLGTENPNKHSVIVFVHGVLSSSQGAWVHSPFIGPDVYWPCLIRQDRAFADFDIFLANYRTELFGPSPSIANVSAQLRDALVSRGVYQYAHIVFVAHSMGGLVVAQHLVDLASKQRMDLLGRVRLVNFFGTPGDGSDLARIAQVVSSNVQFAEMSNPQRLSSLVGQWRSMEWRFKRSCFAESKSIGWLSPVQPVSSGSAAALCNGNSDTLLGFDHLTLVKPKSAASDPHQRLTTKILSCVPARLPEVSDASSDRGRRVRSWFVKLQDSLEKFSTQANDVVLQNLFESENRYLMPIENLPSGLGTDTYALRGDRYFANWISESGIARFLRESRVQSISSIQRLHTVVPDGALRSLREEYTRNGFLSDRDFAVVLVPKASAQRERYILLVGEESESNAAKLLKGYLYLGESATSCE